MNKIWIIAFISVLFWSAKNGQVNLSKSTVKKMDKTLEELWPEQPVSREAVMQGSKQLSFKLAENTLFRVLKDKQPVAYMYLAQAPSKTSYFDYLVVFDSKLAILKVKVLVYREEYGGEIGSKRWLKQFEGKTDPKTIRFGDDVQGISGATISARSLTTDVQKTIRQIVELKQKGVI
ncbi:MAG: FMN-binding protein [Flavobacteriales bacterium]|nr:FMN-binding protein [Flavobacteriales bacterium]